MHEEGPRSERAGVHWQDVMNLGYLVQPGLDLGRLLGGLVARDLDPGLNLSDRNRRQVKIGVGHALEPSQHGAVRPRPAELPDDVSCRAGTSLSGELARSTPGAAGPASAPGESPRGEGVRSSSFRVGRADCWRRRQSLAGARTAASAPRLVTICGPSLRQVSRSWLNRALASWTGQLFMSASVLQNIV